jgi:hypothetical protein
MRRVTRVIIVGAAVLSGLAFLPAGTSQAAPAGGAEYGFAFADRPTTAAYPARPDMSANSAGGVNTVQRHGTGNYTVRMPGLGATDGGNVQVSAYGNHSNRCKTSGWHGAGIAMDIGVVCQNSAGARADTQFTVQYHRGTNNASHQSAHLLMGEASSTPDPTFSFNSKGGANTVTRQATGIWRVEFGAGFTKSGGIVHVTAVGWDSDFCKVRGWGRSHADVRCYTASGQLTNSSWSLRYHDQHLPNGFAQLGAYVWVNLTEKDQDGIWHAPHPDHNFNMQGVGLLNEAKWVSTGRYEVRLPRTPAFDAGNPVVTGHNLDRVTCKVTQLSKSGSSASVKVDCRNQAGALTNSFFTLTHVTNR